MLTETVTVPAFGPYTVQARYYHGDDDEHGVAMASVMFQGSEALRLHVLEEQWPTEKNRKESSWPMPAPSGQTVWEGWQWEYCRRLLYGALRLLGQEPDHGTAKLVEPMRKALVHAFRIGKENDDDGA